jgi:hypothetical protein
VRVKLLNGSLDGNAACSDPCGWKDACFSLKFMEHVSKCTHVTKDKHVLLILDGHASHNNYTEATELATESVIVMHTVPSHACRCLT